MFYFGDIARFFYPTRVLYANALRTGRLPLWTPELFTGFPLFAEMQTGALYPPHLILYRLLPIDLAINYDILLHLAWLGVGLYLFARACGISRVGATIAALAFSAGSFGTGRIDHMSVLAVAAWLPWMLLLCEKWRRSPRLYYWGLLSIVFALQMLAGHPQFIFLNVLTFAVYSGAGALVAISAVRSKADPSVGLGQASAPYRANPWKRGLSTVAAGLVVRYRRFTLALLPLLTVLLGAGIAAVQLVPTAELAQASARSGGVSEAFFTEFSFHPLYLALLFDPFVLGNPYPRISVEVIAYLGAMPLLLAGAAILWRRDRVTLFWLALAVGSFLLALGGFNPLYRQLRFVPLLNFFRVPARFLFPMSFSLAMLSGMGYDVLRACAPVGGLKRSAKIIGVIFAALLVLIIALAVILDADRWVELWRVLSPLFFASALFILLRVRSIKISRAGFATLAVGLTLVDLAAFGAVYAQTFNAVAPRDTIFATPRVLANLDLTGGARTRTSEWIDPWVSVMNESLYPNLNAAYGVQSAQGYTPLVPRRIQDYLDHLSPAMLDLLGVRYYLIPQVLPVDPQSEGADLADPFMLNPVQQPVTFAPTEATGLEVESALAQSVGLRDGDVVANIDLRIEDGRVISVPLRAGFDTAEWAYERSDVKRTVKHSEPPIASTFPARSAFPVESHPGHTYRADLPIAAEPVSVTGIAIDPKIPAGLIHIQKLVLTSGSSHVDLATMVGKSNHKLVYRSEDVAVYENPDYAPRAFLTHNAVRATDEEALAHLQVPDYSGELFLADGEELQSDSGQGLDERVEIIEYQPERVVLNVNADFDAYVVLNDAWDAGWIASVDGEPVPIHRADVIFRAVRVGEGTHHVEFLYRPRSLYSGIILSGVSLVILAMVILAALLIGGRTRHPVI